MTSTNPFFPRFRARVQATAVLTVLALCLGTVRPACAWWAAGHAVIAMMAYRQMKPETRASVDKTLQAHPDYQNWLAELPANLSPAQKGEYIFAVASTWPDRIKDSRDETVGTKFYNLEDKRNPPPRPLPVAPDKYPDLNTHGGWHYYDVPIEADGKKHEAPPEESALTALPVCESRMGNMGLPAPHRAYYLAWTAHLIGDIHQPLHATSRFSAAHPEGDGGGNAVRFKAGSDASAPKNLHAFWDGLLGSGPDTKRYNTLQNGWDDLNATVATIDKETPRLLAGFDPKSENDMDVNEWVRESYGIAQNFVYTFPNVDAVEKGGSIAPPDAEYKQFAVRIAHQRAALAAHRLALACDIAFAAPSK